ncbi:MAG TPA: metallophosphoesterase [Methanosarcinaceae archaeon]|nr:metallophosphoesterase [Methanosarcinaceae archaeon]
MTRIVHLSDIHVSSAHFLTDVAESVVQGVNEISPDILVITGDLTQNGSHQEYIEAKEWIDRIDCRNKVIVPGNHDSRNVGYLLFEDIIGARYSCCSLDGVTVVGVDSSQPDIDDGHIGREMYGWIAEKFNPEEKDFRIFTLHHHLIPVPMTGREEEIPEDSGDVLELLNRCNVDLVLCGHRHVPWVWKLNDMFVLNAGTACSNKIKARTTQCYNLIEIEKDGERNNGWRIRAYHVIPTGERTLIVDTTMNKDQTENYI